MGVRETHLLLDPVSQGSIMIRNTLRGECRESLAVALISARTIWSDII